MDSKILSSYTIHKIQCSVVHITIVVVKIFIITKTIYSYGNNNQIFTYSWEALKNKFMQELRTTKDKILFTN
jgi:hypothetical protein